MRRRSGDVKLSGEAGTGIGITPSRFKARELKWLVLASSGHLSGRPHIIKTHAIRGPISQTTRFTRVVQRGDFPLLQHAFGSQPWQASSKREHHAVSILSRW